MTEVLQANIFFIIASVGVVLFTLLVCVLLYQVIKIVKSVRRIVERVEAGSEVLVEDFENLRENLNPARIVSYVMNIVAGFTPKSRKKNK